MEKLYSVGVSVFINACTCLKLLIAVSESANW